MKSNGLEYPLDLFDDPKELPKWVKTLSKEQLHVCAQDKEAPAAVLSEVAKNAPIKILKNLVHNKKLPPEARVPILRRIYRATDEEIKPIEKIAVYSSIIEIKSWSEREKQTAHSYISEVRKTIGNQPLKKVQKVKKAKIEKMNDKQKQRPIVPPRIIEPPKDSTESEIVASVFLIIGNLQNSNYALSSRLHKHSMGFRTLLDDYFSGYKSLGLAKDRNTSLEVLLQLEIQIQNDCFLNLENYSREEVERQYRRYTRGDLAETLLRKFENIQNPVELIQSLVLTLSSENENEIETKKDWVVETAKSFRDEIDNRQYEIKHIGMNISTSGMASLYFKTEPIVEIGSESIKYWKIIDGINQKIMYANDVFHYDAAQNIYHCTFYKLDSGSTYGYQIFGQIFNLEISSNVMEFQTAIPRVHYENHRSSEISFSVGGGAERRHQQF